MSGRRNYTITELVAVIVIAGMISAFAINQFRKMPTFISLESKVNELKKILAQARNYAACQGMNTKVVFDAEKRRIFMPLKNTDEESPDKKESGIEMFLADDIKFIHDEEEIEENINDEKLVLFSFYPDGTGGGSSVFLQLRKRRFRIDISPLSGRIISREVEFQE